MKTRLPLFLRKQQKDFCRRLACTGLVLLSLVSPAVGQCPTSACTPGNAPAANVPFGMGIYRVRVANLDTLTNGASDGYRDYSCRPGAVLQRGQTYTLRVDTNADEAVAAWIDYDDNGQFSPAEQVLTSAAARQHHATFTVPATALTGRALRLRIAADYANALGPTACSAPQYSQTEDYQVRLGSTVAAPRAAFAASDSVTCNGSVHFADRSGNTPTSWRWDFGDGAVSTQANPVHTYLAPGAYTVRLRVCNGAGCDSLTRPAFAVVRDDGPRPMPCRPLTSAYCCDFGLARVRLTGLDHRPGGGAQGYQDASCALRATLRADWPDTLRLATGGTAGHDVRVYLDANDDGLFGPAELLYTGLGVLSPTAIVQVNSSAPGLVYNKALRLRVWTDYAGSPARGPCADPVRGQAVDYSVLVLPNTVKPQANFRPDYPRTCGPVEVDFQNTSVGGTAYHWDFGDGTTSTAATPPRHRYATPGVYPVQLTASNSTHVDSTTRQIVVAATCPTYCTTAGLGGSASTPVYFTRVQLAGLNNPVARTLGVGYHFAGNGPGFALRPGLISTGMAISPQRSALGKC